MIITTDNWSEVIPEMAKADATRICDGLPDQAKDSLTFVLINAYAQLCYYKSLPFLTPKPEANVQREFIEFLLKVSGLYLTVAAKVTPSHQDTL